MKVKQFYIRLTIKDNRKQRRLTDKITGKTWNTISHTKHWDIDKVTTGKVTEFILERLNQVEIESFSNNLLKSIYLSCNSGYDGIEIQTTTWIGD